MPDYDNDIYSEPDYSRYKDDRDTRKSSNSIIYIVIIALLALGILTLTYFYFFNKSDYEKGVVNLNMRQYDAALVDFQKVPPTDAEFIKAQSKIDYINGVRLFNQNDYPKAKVYLQKVSPSDEFYNEVKLMMEKITANEKEIELKEQLEQDEQKKIADAQKETEQKIRDADASKKYASDLLRIEDKFESEFQLAKVENAVTMKKNLRNMTTIRQELLDKEYAASSPAQDLVDYKTMLNQWMNNQINFIQKAVQENVLTISDVTPETAAIGEEGEKSREKLAAEKEKLKTAYSIKN